MRPCHKKTRGKRPGFLFFYAADQAIKPPGLEIDLPFGARVENVGVGIANALAFVSTIYVVIIGIADLRHDEKSRGDVDRGVDVHLLNRLAIAGVTVKVQFAVLKAVAGLDGPHVGDVEADNPQGAVTGVVDFILVVID